MLRFGEPVAGRGLVTEPGLHYKIPIIENVIYLDNRILDVESPNLEVLASDNQRLEVDSFIRYRIVDPLRFYQSVGGIAGANNQLASVLNSAVRRVLSEANQTRDRARRARRPDGQDQGSGQSRGAQIRRHGRRRAHPPGRSAPADLREGLSAACRPSVRARRPSIAPRAPSRRRTSPPRPIAT